MSYVTVWCNKLNLILYLNIGLAANNNQWSLIGLRPAPFPRLQNTSVLKGPKLSSSKGPTWPWAGPGPHQLNKEKCFFSKIWLTVLIFPMNGLSNFSLEIASVWRSEIYGMLIDLPDMAISAYFSFNLYIKNSNQ